MKEDVYEKMMEASANTALALEARGWMNEDEYFLPRTNTNQHEQTTR